MSVSAVRAAWAAAVIEEWKQRTIKRVVAMADLGAREARIPVGGCVTSDAVKEALLEAGLSHHRVGSDYMISWEAPVEREDEWEWEPYARVTWEALASILRERAYGKPIMSRVEAATQLAMVECMARAMWAAAHLSNNTFVRIGDRDADLDRVIAALKQGGFVVDNIPTTLDSEKATGTVASLALSGWT